MNWCDRMTSAEIGSAVSGREIKPLKRRSDIGQDACPSEKKSRRERRRQNSSASEGGLEPQRRAIVPCIRFFHFIDKDAKVPSDRVSRSEARLDFMTAALRRRNVFVRGSRLVRAQELEWWRSLSTSTMKPETNRRPAWSPRNWLFALDRANG
jgi:hypothetical protein